MPENRALSGLCSGIIEAYDLFGVPSAVVLFVVEEVSYNICDQRFHEFEIFEKRPDIMVSNVNYLDSVCVSVFFFKFHAIIP